MSLKPLSVSSRWLRPPQGRGKILLCSIGPPLCCLCRHPSNDQAEWNVTGSLRAYHLSKAAASAPKDLSRPGHVPGMIKTTLFSIKDVIKNPKLRKLSHDDDPADGGSPSQVEPPSRTHIGYSRAAQPSTGGRAIPSH